MSFRIRWGRRARLHGSPIIASAGLLLVCASFPGGAPATAAERFVAIAWNDSQQGGAAVQRFRSESPWAFDGDAIAVGSNPTLRFAGNRLYAVSHADGSVTAIDGASWSVARVYALGAQSHPLDIAVVSPEIAYLTTSDSTQLLRLNLDTGVVQSALDVAGFANPGGLLVAGMMAVDAGRLFVQVSRFESAAADAALAVDPTGYLAVVDIATEQLVDVDPIAKGIQAIALQGTFPKYKMKLLRDPRRLYVSASGAYFDDGGLEQIDLDALASLGLVIAEANGNTAADLGSFVMVAPDRGLLVSSTDFAPSSHLARFSLMGGVQLEELFVTVDYRVPTMVHDPQTHTIFVPDGGFANAYWVFDADSGEKLNRDPPRLGGPATDIELLCDPEQSCDCAVGYGCQAVPAASKRGLVLLGLSLILTGVVFVSAHALDLGIEENPT
jgi:hypothetical protein